MRTTHELKQIIKALREDDFKKAMFNLNYTLEFFDELNNQYFFIDPEFGWGIMYFADTKEFDILEFRKEIPSELRRINSETAIKFIMQ